MFHSFGKEAGWVHIDYLTEDFKMDPTHNVGTFLRLLEWFSAAQLLYPKTSNDKEVGCLFSDSRKKQILRNYAFKLSEDEIHNTNKTWYSDFHRYTEANSVSILSEEIKASKMNKISETKKSKDNSSVAANAGNNKIKILSRRKSTIRVIPTLE